MTTTHYGLGMDHFTLSAGFFNLQVGIWPQDKEKSLKFVIWVTV